MPVTLIVNGKEIRIQDRISVSEFLTLRGFDPNSVVVERNLAMIPKEAFTNTILEENDRLEILRFVGGG